MKKHIVFNERINAVRDELAQICPATVAFRVGEETQIQVTESGQGGLLWVAPSGAQRGSRPDSG